MPFTKYTNLDFDQIKTSIKDYLRANSNFTDFDFEGSNFSVLIDTLAYNTYISSFNSNMIVNESFLDSATLRENVVSLARNIGYVPRSRTSARARISFTVQRPSGDSSSQVTLQRGLVCTGSSANTSYVFSIPEVITKKFVSGVATFNNIEIYEGTYLTKQFLYDGSLDQKFILDNSFVDTSSLKVYIKKENDTGLGIEYSLVDNIVDVTPSSQIYLIQEIQDEKYQLLFGDGLIGKKLGTDQNSDGNIITANYIVSNGAEGNGVSNFSLSGSFLTTENNNVNPSDITVTTNQASQNGSEIESIDSVRYYAPKIYSAQSRAVTGRDYEAIIKSIYPDTESVAVVGVEVPNGGFSLMGDELLGIFIEYLPGGLTATDTIDYSNNTGDINPFYFYYYREANTQAPQGVFISEWDTTSTNTSNFLFNTTRYSAHPAASSWRNDQTSINMSYSHEISITASGTSTFGIQNEDLTTVSIFPNPSNGVVNVELDTDSDATITVVDVLGQVVYTSNENFTAGERKMIDLSSNAKGMYILSVEGEGVNTVERITIK